MVSMVAVGILVVHAVWCLLCKRVSDGIVGKLLYGLLSLAALAYLSRPDPYATAMLHVALAAIAVRHFWMKTYWLRIKQRMLTWLPTRSHPHASPAKSQSRRR
jgi:hypothetical protein